MPADVGAVERALKELERFAHLSDQERDDINAAGNRASDGNVGYTDVVSDTLETIRAELAALREAVKAAEKDAKYWRNRAGELQGELRRWGARARDAEPRHPV